MYTIKGTRKKLGMSQAEIGRMMGMTQQAITRIEASDRKETQIHINMLSMIQIIAKYGLLSDLYRDLDLIDSVKVMIDDERITKTYHGYPAGAWIRKALVNESGYITSVEFPGHRMSLIEGDILEITGLQGVVARLTMSDRALSTMQKLVDSKMVTV